MPYLTVVDRSGIRLILKRSPGLRSWMTSLGILCVALLAFTYIWGIEGNIPWLLCYCAGSVLFSLSTLDEWETCYFDKTKGTVSLSKKNIFEKLRGSAPHSVVLNLHTISCVTVKSEAVKYMRMKVHTVCLVTEEGQCFGITDCGTSGDRSEHEAIRDVITVFLKDVEGKEVSHENKK